MSQWRGNHAPHFIAGRQRAYLAHDKHSSFWRRQPWRNVGVGTRSPIFLCREINKYSHTKENNLRRCVQKKKMRQKLRLYTKDACSLEIFSRNVRCVWPRRRRCQSGDSLTNINFLHVDPYAHIHKMYMRMPLKMYIQIKLK